jgi:hypothetical protein
VPMGRLAGGGQSRGPTYVEVSLAGELIDEELRGIGEEELIAGGSENHLGHRQTVPAQGAGSVSFFACNRRRHLTA